LVALLIVDVRCAAIGADGRRCQLYAGHTDHHAALVEVDAQRVLRTWLAEGVARDEAFGPDVPRQLPWAPTFPVVEAAGVEQSGAGAADIELVG
jgi:hypothetical protein